MLAGAREGAGVDSMARAETALLRLAAGICLLLTGTVATPGQASQRDLIVYGDANFPPYESLVDSKPTGANVELWMAIGRVLDRRVELRLVAWPDAQQQVLAG